LSDEAVREEIRRSALEDAARERLFNQWEDVVGGDYGVASRPVKLEAGELTVEVPSKDEADYLMRHVAEIIARIDSQVAPRLVTKISFSDSYSPWFRGGQRGPGR
jgi:predicted nucleic acid-binding Zn ribbon protein